MTRNIESKAVLDPFEETDLRANNNPGTDSPSHLSYFEEHYCKHCKKKTTFEYVGIENLSKHTYRYACIKGHIQILDLKNNLEKRKVNNIKGRFRYASAY